MCDTKYYEMIPILVVFMMNTKNYCSHFTINPMQICIMHTVLNKHCAMQNID